MQIVVDLANFDEEMLKQITTGACTVSYTHLIIGIASIAYAANIMENMITKETRIAFLMLPATMIEKFVARFLIVMVGMAAAIIAVSYTHIESAGTIR